MHYAHTDGGVSTIRCLDQSVDEPPDSPARAPRVGAFAAHTKTSVARTFAVEGLPRVGKTVGRPTEDRPVRAVADYLVTVTAFGVTPSRKQR